MQISITKEPLHAPLCINSFIYIFYGNVQNLPLNMRGSKVGANLLVNLTLLPNPCIPALEQIMVNMLRVVTYAPKGYLIMMWAGNRVVLRSVDWTSILFNSAHSIWPPCNSSCVHPFGRSLPDSYCSCYNMGRQVSGFVSECESRLLESVAFHLRLWEVKSEISRHLQLDLRLQEIRICSPIHF